MSEKTTIARRGHYLTVPVAFVTEALQTSGGSGTERRGGTYIQP